MKKLASLAAILLLLTTAWAADKNADQKARDQYAKQFALDVEHDGWQLTAAAMHPGCSTVLCFKRGNHDALTLFWNGGTVDAVDRFMREEIEPRRAELRDLGFLQIDIVGVFTSQNYPDGVARFPVKEKVQ